MAQVWDASESGCRKTCEEKRDARCGRVAKNLRFGLYEVLFHVSRIWHTRGHERKPEGHRRIEQGLARGTYRDQSIFPARGNVRKLGLPEAFRVHQETIDRRDAPCRIAAGADSFSGWRAHHGAAEVGDRL